MRDSTRLWRVLTTVSALACGSLLFFLPDTRMSVSAQDDFLPRWNCKLAHGSSCEEVSFYVFTRNNVDSPQLVTAANLSSSYFDPSKPTTLLIHGYSAGMYLSQLVQVKRAYLKRSDQNVLMVHYLSLAATPCYLFAVINIRYIADCMETFVRSAVQQGLLKTVVLPYDSPPKRILKLHAVAFSLGAHVAGLLGKRLNNDHKLERITGLDPAMPMFMMVSDSRKLMKTDAYMVDVFHTNAFFQGKPSHIGHIDFYFNGGITQPGCDTNVLKILECDHHRALEYFGESINSDQGFWGWKCDSDLHMFENRCPPEGTGVLAGENWNGQTAGVYLVDTSDRSPYARGRWWVESGYVARTIPRVQRNYETLPRVIRAITQRNTRLPQR